MTAWLAGGLLEYNMRQVSLLVLLSVLSTSLNAATDSHIEAARALLDASESERIVDSVYGQMDAMLQNLSEQLNVPPEQQEILDKYNKRIAAMIRQEMSWSRMEPFMLETYVQLFSEEELNQLTGFYLSPIGQKFIARMPKVVEASTLYTQQIVQGYMPKLMAIERELRQEIARSAAAGQGSPAE